MNISERDHIEGAADAPLTLLEYGDYQCPYCGAAYPGRQTAAKKAWEETSIRVQKFSTDAGASVCADRRRSGRGRRAAGESFGKCTICSLNSNVCLSRTSSRYGQKNRAGSQTIRRRHLSKAKLRNASKKTRKSGIRSGVNGTPTFFINGTRHDDAPDYETLLAALGISVDVAHRLVRR